jgi:hypothetical protein
MKDISIYRMKAQVLHAACLELNPECVYLIYVLHPEVKLHILAALMENQGEIITLDKYESRIKILQKNITATGI